jgi:hypothetical protein
LLPQRVLLLWEAFLLQMNDFDLTLELKLRHLLDPVVATTPPPRRGSKKAAKPILAIVQASIEPIAVAIPGMEPVVVTVPVALQVL